MVEGTLAADWLLMLSLGDVTLRGIPLVIGCLVLERDDNQSSSPSLLRLQVLTVSLVRSFDGVFEFG